MGLSVGHGGHAVWFTKLSADDEEIRSAKGLARINRTSVSAMSERLIRFMSR